MTMIEETKKPSWLKRIRKGEEIMERIDPVTEPVEAPPVATIPLPVQQSEVDLTPPAVVPMSEHLRQLAASAEQHETDKAEVSKVIEQARDRIKDLARENGFLKLELAQEKNDKQTLQAMVYDLQQKNADLRALQSELYALAMHVVSRYEHEEIPLPARKRAKKNGDKTVKDFVEATDPVKALDEVTNK